MHSRMKKICNALFKILTVGAALVLYFTIVSPLVFTFIVPPLFVHKGVQKFETGTFEKYENGALFREYVDSLLFPQSGKAIDFYHINHLLRDNPFYGKYWDLFSVDIQLEKETYIREKRKATESSQYRYAGELDDFVLYAVHGETSVKVLAFCDDACIIRCILVTDHPQDAMLWNLFVMHTDLNWKIDQ